MAAASVSEVIALGPLISSVSVPFSPPRGKAGLPSSLVLLGWKVSGKNQTIHHTDPSAKPRNSLEHQRYGQVAKL